MNEIWKDIEGFEGRYQVSSFGNVKSLMRKVERIDGFCNYLPERILTPVLGKESYYRITLSKFGHVSTFLIHRLVAAAFIPNLENKKEVNHINGVRRDNRLENLEWCTRTENAIHAINVLGYRPRGVATVYPEHLKPLTAIARDGQILKFNNQAEAADKLKLNQGLICLVLNGKRSHTGGYSFIDVRDTKERIKRTYKKYGITPPDKKS